MGPAGCIEYASTVEQKEESMRSKLIGVAVAGALAMTLVRVGTAGARGGNAVLTSFTESPVST